MARPPDGPIRWLCSACGLAGVVSGWEDSLYDLRRRGLAVAPAAADIVLTSQVASALRDLRLLDRNCERLVFATRADDEQVVLSASAQDLEELSDGVAAEGQPRVRPPPTPPSTPSPELPRP